MTAAWETFPPETLDALFEAIEINDVVDPVVSLPEPIDLSCSTGEMRRCFALCLQFWREGARRADLLELIGTLLDKGDLSPDERRRYKHIRARYKHLRFALTLYGERHRPPGLFNVTVAMMGHLQDAFRNGNPKAVTGYGLALRALLARPVWAAVLRRIMAVRLEDAEGLLAYRKAEIGRLRQALAQETLTGHQFHALRKIVSRQGASYNDALTLAPSDHHYKMTRFLAAINGLMGSRHDEMVEQAAAGERSYRTAQKLDEDIRRRLEQLARRYPL